MISREEFKTIAGKGIWKQNSSIAQILGLCPLLAVTTNAVNGVMLSLATILVMAISNLAVSALRNFIPHEIRIPVFILIVAALVTVVDLLFNANLHELYLVLGIFMGVGMLWTLALLGAMRELIGAGTLFGGIDMVFPSLHPIQLLPESYPNFLLAMLPPGAFILLGCMIAWKNWMDARAAERAKLKPPAPVAMAGSH